MNTTIRKVGPVNINSSYAGILRISPNLKTGATTGSDMGFDEISSLLSGDEGFEDGLGIVSDSNGTYSCLSLGVARAKFDGDLTIGSEGESSPDALKVYGSGWFYGDIEAVGDIKAQHGTFDSGIEVGKESIVFHTPRIEFVPLRGDDTFARTYIDLSRSNQGNVLLSSEDGGFEGYPLLEVYDLIEQMHEKMDSLEGLFDTRYVRQDEEHSVQRISSVYEYPANPDAATLYLRREK